MPASPWHDYGAQRIKEILKAAATQAGADVYVVGVPDDVSTSAGIRKPDVLVVPRDVARSAIGRRVRTYYTSDLLLVAEVVSPRSGSERTDRVQKVRECAKAEIPLYWIIELDPGDLLGHVLRQGHHRDCGWQVVGRVDRQPHPAAVVRRQPWCRADVELGRQVADAAERCFISHLRTAAVVSDGVPEPVDVLPVDLAAQQLGNRFRVVIRVAHGEVQISGKPASVPGVQLAESGPALEDKMIEYSPLAQPGEEEILGDVDEGGLPAARSLRRMAGQPVVIRLMRAPAGCGGRRGGARQPR